MQPVLISSPYGMPARMNAPVIPPRTDLQLADALTKVFFVAGPERALAVARRWQVDALWVDKRGHWSATPGLALAAA